MEDGGCSSSVVHGGTHLLLAQSMAAVCLYAKRDPLMLTPFPARFMPAQ